MKRLFIGIPLVSEIAVKQAEVWKNDQELNCNVLKWSKPENWHVTLIFLGLTPIVQIKILELLIEESFSGIKAFKTELRGVGVFPNTHNPKVLWLGLENIESLIPARTQTLEILLKTGFLLDNKPLNPHLTLARVKNAGHRDSFKKLLDRYESYPFGTVALDKIVLYESVSTSDGPVYKPLFVYELDK